MANKDYRKAYEAAVKELDSLLLQKKQIEARVISVRKTLNALSTLLQESGDKGWLANLLGAVRETEESLTDDIHTAVAQSTEPMTTTDVLNELKKFSQSVSQHKNPLATINAVLKRLVEQGKIIETTKDGRKAWVTKSEPYARFRSLVHKLAEPESMGDRMVRIAKEQRDKPKQ